LTRKVIMEQVINYFKEEYMMMNKLQGS
jgi:hypothetical protein